MSTLRELIGTRTPGRSRWWWVLLVAVGMPVIAVLAQTPDLTSEGLAGATLRFASPILLAGLGGMWAERSGMLNIGLDGAMVIGSWTGAFVGLSYGPWAALLAGLLGGVLCGLFQAVASQWWQVDQAIVGIVINMAALGVVRFLSSMTFADMQGGSISQSPTLETLPLWSVPGVDALLRPVAEADVLWLSDLARILLGLTTGLSAGTVIALAMVPVSWWVLSRTRFGLRVRLSGENPGAADALGISPFKIRYAALSISGALAGLGGAYMVVAASSLYREGQVAGRGFIGLATVVFGNWNPIGVLGGSVLFGFTDALQTRQAQSVDALLLVGALALLVRVAWLLWRRRALSAIAPAVIGGAVLAWFLVGPDVPSELISMAPYLATLIVLVGARQDLRPPAAVGEPYRRSEE